MRKGASFILLLLALLSQHFAEAQSWKQSSDSAKYFTDRSQTREALYHYEKARTSLAADSSSTNTYIQLLRNMGIAYYNAQEYTKALPYFEEALKISESLNGKDVQYASLLNILAATYTQAGEYVLVEKIHQEAKAIREKLLTNQHPAYAQSCNNLGFYYLTIGNYAKAEPLILEGKAIREKLLPLKQHLDYATSCTNLANLYREMGQYDKAEALYIEAKDIRAKIEPIKQTEDYAKSCNILADLYNFRRDYIRSEPLYLEAKAIRAENKQSLTYAESCNNLFALYRDMGRYAEAESIANEARNIYQTSDNPDDPNLAINFNNLGELYYKIGQLERAESYYMNARKLWEKQLGKEHPYYIINSNALARLYRQKGDIAKADAYFTSAANSDFQRINSFFQFTSENEKSAYIKNISGTADEYLSLYHKELNKLNAVQPLAMTLRNRNLILASSQQLRHVIYKSTDTALHAKFEEWFLTRQILAKLLATPNRSGNSLSTMENKANQLEKELSRKSSLFKASQLSVPDWKKVQSALKVDEAAIEFISFQYFNGNSWTDSVLYSALVLRKDRQPMMLALFEKQQLDELFKGGSAGMYSPHAEVAGYNIYDLIWKPLEKSLQGVNKVFYTPAGRLHQVSFAAIPFSKTQSLSDRFELVQLNSTSLLMNKAASEINSSDLVKLYGGVIYEADSSRASVTPSVNSSGVARTASLPEDLTRGATWTYLPGTKTEITAIRSLAVKRKYRTDLREGVNATEESVKALHGRASPQVLHIATHGFFFPDPKEDRRSDFQKSFDKSGAVFKRSDDPLMRSGLLFARSNEAWTGKPQNAVEDGILTSYEVSGLFLPNTKLAVLSACETALGDVQGSEGVYGLQRAFKMAGVQHLLMSLWKVPDVETAEFMQHFYQHYFDGKNVTAAFAVAQKAMKQKYRNEPVKWAAWILVR